MDFISRLNAVRKHTENELIEAEQGKSGCKSVSQLKSILSELTAMEASLGDSETIHPYFPKGIADCWPPNDCLGRELNELSSEYFNLKLNERCRQHHGKRGNGEL